MLAPLTRRRVANRESARRVRQKRQETMEELQLRMSKVCYGGNSAKMSTMVNSSCQLIQMIVHTVADVMVLAHLASHIAHRTNRLSLFRMHT